MAFATIHSAARFVKTGFNIPDKKIWTIIPPREMSQKERQLLTAVEKGHTKMVETLISQGVSVNCKARDDGSTPLIKAANCRNHVVQKLLLQHGADISAKNLCYLTFEESKININTTVNPLLSIELGLTALHYTAEAGDTDTVKLLLAYKSPLDVPDVEGCTPLHYAAYRKNLATAEILFFCGANVDLKNEKRLSPFTTNRNKEFRVLARQSRKVREAIDQKDIRIEHDELHPGKTSHLKDIGLKIFTPDNFKLHSLSFLCRRVRPEFCADSLKPVGKEILISDAFEYITSTVHINGEVELEVPLYDHPDTYEIIQIKSNLGNIEDPSAIAEGPIKYNGHSGVLRWKIRIRLDITKTKSFILITIPKVERFKVNPMGGEFVSEVDKFISIEVAPDTFKTGIVNVEVIPTPVYKTENFKNILSIGNFYELHHSLGSNKFQKNGVTFTSPLPHKFENEGELCVLAADIPMHFDPDQDILDENIWEILDKNPKTKKGRVSFDLSHFSTLVLAEKRKGTIEASLKTQVNEIFMKACKKAKVVCFFAVLKPKADFHYEIVLECTTPEKVTDRLNQWKSFNFIALSPESTGDFDSRDRQEYNIKLSGNIKKEFGTTKLQFHSKRKRNNFQRFVISFTNQDKPAFVSLDVMEMPKEQKVTSIMVWLPEMSVETTPLKSEDLFKGFIWEKVLKKIASKLGNEWIPFCVLLGIPFRKVHEMITETSGDNSTENKIMKVLLEWRKYSQSLDDMGVVDLVTALFRVERNDVADLVLQNIKEWLKENDFENEDRFHKWAEKALNGTLDISRTEDCFEPMSDEFFVLLVEKFANPEFQNLAVLLGISEDQNSNIFADTDFPNYRYKVLHMFIVARERQKDRLNALTKLTEALKITENIECLQWVHDCIKKWSQNTNNKEKRTTFQLNLEKSIRREAGENFEEDENNLEEKTELIGDHQGENRKVKEKHESQHTPDKEVTITKELDKSNDEDRNQDENIGKNREMHENSDSDLKAVTIRESVVVIDDDVKLSKVTIMKQVEDTVVKLQENEPKKLEENKSELKKNEKEEHPGYCEKNDYELKKVEKEKEQKEENSRNYESKFMEAKSTGTNSKDSERKRYEHKVVNMIDEQIDKSKCNHSDLEKLENSKDSKNKVKEIEEKHDNKENTSTPKLSDSKNELCRDEKIHKNHGMFGECTSDHKDIAVYGNVVFKDSDDKVHEANIIQKVEEANIKLPENKEELEEKSELKEDEKEKHPEYSENNKFKLRKDKKDEQYKHSRYYESISMEDEKPDENHEGSESRNQDHKEVQMIDVQLNQSKGSISDFAKIENLKEKEEKIMKIDTKHNLELQDNLHKEDTSSELPHCSKKDESEEYESKCEDSASDHQDFALRESVLIADNAIKSLKWTIVKKVEELEVKLQEDQQEELEKRSGLKVDGCPGYSNNNDYELRKDMKEEQQKEHSRNYEYRFKEDEKPKKNCEDSESRIQDHKEVKIINVELDQSECCNSDFTENSKEKENEIKKKEAKHDLESQDELDTKDTSTKVLCHFKIDKSKEADNKCGNHEGYEDSVLDQKNVTINESVVIEDRDVKISEATTCTLKAVKEAKVNLPEDQLEKLDERSELKEDGKKDRPENSENENKIEEHSRNFESTLKEEPGKSHEDFESKYDGHKEVKMEDKQLDQSECSILDFEKNENSKEKENNIKKIVEKHDIESQHKLDIGDFATKQYDSENKECKEDENLIKNHEVYGDGALDQKEDAIDKSVVIKDDDVKLCEANTCIMKEGEETEVKLPDYQQENLKEHEPNPKQDEKEDQPEYSETNNYKLTKNKKEEKQKEHSRNYRYQEHIEVKMIDEQLDQALCCKSDLKNLDNSEDKSTRIHQDELKYDDTEASTSNKTNSDKSNENYSEAYTLENQQLKHHRYKPDSNEKPQGGTACIVSDTDVTEGTDFDITHQIFKDKRSDLDEDKRLDNIQGKNDESDSYIGVCNSEDQKDRSI